LGIAAHSNSCIHVGRELGTTKEERIGLCAFTHDNFCDESPFDNKIEPRSLKLLLDAEDLVEDAGLVWIGLSKAKGEDLHLGSWYMVGESVGRAICFDANLLAQDDPGRICKAIQASAPRGLRLREKRDSF
jgi:hypothetical protein